MVQIVDVKILTPHRHLSLNCEGRWDTTDVFFTTSVKILVTKTTTTTTTEILNLTAGKQQQQQDNYNGIRIK